MHRKREGKGGGGHGESANTKKQKQGDKNSTIPLRIIWSRIITLVSVSLICFSSCSSLSCVQGALALLLLPLSLAFGYPSESTGGAVCGRDASGFLGGALMMRRLLV